MKFLLLAAVSAFSLGSALAQERAAEILGEKNFASLHALMKPTAAELEWEKITWRTDLWAARKEAAEKGKPIYLWEMDGHPLGCT